MQDKYALVLEIIKQNRNLLISLFERKESASTLRQYSRLPVSFAEINKLCQEALSVLNRVNKKGILEFGSVDILKKTCCLLWNQLLPKPVKDRLKSAQNSDLVLLLDEGLISIPWEILYTGEEFLCLKFNLGRLVRICEKMSAPRYRDVSDKRKMLILANPTSDLKSAYLEGVYIKNQLDKKRNEISVNFKSTCIDSLYVKRSLHDYDIVHFAGHCEYHPKELGESGWVLSNGRFTIKDILSLGESLALPTLVFSNACHSAEIMRDSLDNDYQGRAYSLASAFLFSGTRLYIGAVRKIEDNISNEFAKEFYNQLICGKTVGECLRLARISLVKEYDLNSVSWANYLLYGDPGFVLFRPDAKSEVKKAKKYPLRFGKYSRRSLLLLFIISLCAYLYFCLPTLNPEAYILFAKSNKLFLKGRNHEVIRICADILKKDPLFLPVYPMIADAYQRLGESDTALKYYFDYALYSEKKHNPKDLTFAYIGIGWIYQAKGDYPKAFDFYNQALNLTVAKKDKANEAAVLRKLALWYIDKEDYDKALELLTKSSEINRRRQYLPVYRYNLACDYFDIGLVFANKDDFTTAREFYTQSQRLFEKLKLKRELSDCYFNLGEIYLLEKQYHKALDYYAKGLEIDEAQDNKTNLASDYNMFGELYTEMDNLSEAEKFFKQSIIVSQKIKAELDFAAASYNLGLLYKKRGLKNKARESLRQAQEIYSHIDTPAYRRVKQELLSLD